MIQTLEISSDYRFLAVDNTDNFYRTLLFLPETVYTDSMDDMLQKQGLDEIYRLVAGTDDQKLIADFFECLFTSAELQDIAKRWLLVKEIDKGTTQREIARIFSMSLCKITRGSRELKKKDSAFRIMLDRAADFCE